MMRPLGSFPGGLILDGQKNRSTQLAIRKAPLSKTLILPLQQHIGEASIPTVVIGERVLKGQMIARASGHVSVNLHAPSSGYITAIDNQNIPHPSELSALSISIETDGKEEWAPLIKTDHYRTLSAHDLRQHIRYAGIVGLGGAGFPTFIKLNPGIHHFVDTLILNGVECEPYITCDDMIMRERAEGILDGIAIMRHAIKAKICIIAIEDNKPEAITAMQAALSQHSDQTNTEIVIVPTRYPAGSEKQLIQVITGLQVPNNKLPIDIGIVMHNVGTAYAIGRAITHGEPLISRIVTITGQNVNKAGNLEVLLGSPIRDLLDFCEATTQNPSQLLLGGPMMGYHLTSSDLPITKTSNCILAGVEKAVTEPTPMPCIRCGECAAACPVSLLPQQIYWHAKAKELDKTREYSLFDCIECGCCSYVCPSEIPLVQYFRFAKTEIMNQEDEKKKSNIARVRHENRQARQETEKREKDLRQQRRKAALASEKTDKETP